MIELYQLNCIEKYGIAMLIIGDPATDWQALAKI